MRLRLKYKWAFHKTDGYHKVALQMRTTRRSVISIPLRRVYREIVAVGDEIDHVQNGGVSILC